MAAGRVDPVSDRSPSVVPIDVMAARRRLEPYLRPTPLVASEWLSQLSGSRVWLKLELLLPTHSFKFRGALHALLRLREAPVPPACVVTASAGNHGAALALAAGRLGMRAVVFTPAAAPRTKRDAIRGFGAELRDHAASYDEAEEAARQFAQQAGVPYVSPYNHADVIAGAGTIGLELLDQLPEIDVVVIPLGGGGLASGVGLALKAASPHLITIGVEVEASTPFAVGLRQGAITPIAVRPSVADGLTGNLEPGSMTFPLVREYIDRVVSVGEEAVAAAMRGLIDHERLILEGAGAVATAAVLSGELRAGRRAVVLATGSNLDQTRSV